VLQQVTGRVPLKEAAERLKALRPEHPEAFEEPAQRLGSASDLPQFNRPR